MFFGIGGETFPGSVGTLLRDMHNINELYKRICEYYKTKGFGKGERRSSEIKYGREMFVYLAKEKTSALNKEISGIIGNLSPSGVTHRYKRTLRKLDSTTVSCMLCRADLM